MLDQRRVAGDGALSRARYRAADGGRRGRSGRAGGGADAVAGRADRRGSAAAGAGGAHLRSARAAGGGGTGRARLTRVRARRSQRGAAVNYVFLGLSITSAWGNGHATTYRSLLRALSERGHRVTFLERDTPWYAAHRDLSSPAFCTTHLYRDLGELRRRHDA